MRDLPAYSPTQIPEPPLARFLFADTRLAWFWLIVRVYVGWEWLVSGWGKTQNPAWFGASAGAALTGFVNGALQKTEGAHPDVSAWYAAFLQTVVLPNATFFSNLVTLGELLVGIGLILGALTGIAAFFGSVMNANFLLAGTVSTNPLMFILATWLVLAWRSAGWWGLDRWLLPLLGTPWAPGQIAQRKATSSTTDTVPTQPA
jgi:thiosulfate dehydrogenase [quinone] large subunit